MRAKGWYVVDDYSGMCHRGPYRLPETAGAVRAEMEMHIKNDKWNLVIVNNVTVDKYDSRRAQEPAHAQR